MRAELSTREGSDCDPSVAFVDSAVALSSLLPAVKSCRSGTDFFLFCFLDLLKVTKTKDERVSFAETTLSAGKQLI